VDRWNRKLVMILCDALTAVAPGWSLLSPCFFYMSSRLLHIAIVLFLTGDIGIFFVLASTAAIPQIVD